METIYPDTPAIQASGLCKPSLSVQFSALRMRSLALAAPLSAEDCQVQSMPNASPVKWHLAHTTWFFETFILARFQSEYVPFSDAFRMLFNSYYNAVGAQHPRPYRGMLTRPALDEVLAYRRHVDSAMNRLAAAVEGKDAQFDTLLELGLHHEQQHQELILTDIKHMLSCNPLAPPYIDPPASLAPSVSPRAIGWLRYEGGSVRIGHDAQGFAFDNEWPAHDTLIQTFDLADRLVTQQEYLAFMEDGGYRRPELWLSAGWDNVTNRRAQAPLYWQNDSGEWRLFTLHGMRPLDLYAPVTHVSYFEADAYARWAGARLPREAEWECAAKRLARPHAQPEDNFLESAAFCPRAGIARHDAEPIQMFGDTWEWTCSAYDAYPGYRTPAGAVGEYNGKFMCNQYVLRGGSCVTPRSHIRATYRNFFPADAQWQFSGIRLARESLPPAHA